MLCYIVVGESKKYGLRGMRIIVIRVIPRNPRNMCQKQVRFQTACVTCSGIPLRSFRYGQQCLQQLRERISRR